MRVTAYPYARAVTDFVEIDPAGITGPIDTDGPVRGLLLSWRWVDQEHGRWTALVRYRNGQHLQFERWVDGAYLRRV